MESVKALVVASAVLLSPASVTSAAPAESVPAAQASLTLSPVLLELFRAEMRELLAGTQAIAAALPVGDWERIVATSRQMKASYVLAKKLTPAQEKELAALPERFLELDANFHARTGKLAEAAGARDPEEVAFQYGRLLEACVGCHASYGQARFPALGAPAPDAHHH